MVLFDYLGPFTYLRQQFEGWLEEIHEEPRGGIQHPPSVMERLQSALNEAARRLTGKSADAIRDDAEFDLVSCDLQTSFIEKLSDTDLASLVSGMEAIIAGSSAAGLPA